MAQLTREQMIGALEGLIAHGKELKEEFLKTLKPWSPLFVGWLVGCHSTIESIYGSNSDALSTFKNIFFVPPPGKTYESDEDRAADGFTWFLSGFNYAIIRLVGHLYSIHQLLPKTPDRPTPYVFISHGGPTMTHVHSARDLLRSIGLYPIIVAEETSFNLSVNQKVRHYMGMCTSAIVLATVEDEQVAKEQGTRPNVEHEVGLLQASSNIGDRIAYCKEDKVTFASNYREKVWIPFEKERLERSYIPLLREIRGFGLLGP